MDFADTIPSNGPESANNESLQLKKKTDNASENKFSKLLSNKAGKHKTK